MLPDFLILLSPLLALASGGVFAIIGECFPSFSRTRLSYFFSLLGTLCALLAIYFLWNATLLPAPQNMAGWLREFNRSFLVNHHVLVLFTGIVSFVLFALLLLPTYFEKSSLAEGSILVAFVGVGMLLLASANSLLMVFLAIEFFSLPSYVLVGLKREDRRGAEAALKYFLFGSLASVFLVLAIALIYAQFGTLNLTRISEAIPNLEGTPLISFCGLALLLIAFAFKIGAAPFHMWVPDVYQGAPAPITGFMGSAVKLTAFGFLARLLWGTFDSFQVQWVGVIWWLAVFSMFAGNLAALVQDNLKRIFAYSSIAHAGYLLVGIVSGKMAADYLYYYLMVYGLLFTGFFAFLTYLEKTSKNLDISQLSGLGFRQPVIGACLSFIVLCSAGIPPTAGFLAKYFLFFQAIQAGETLLVVLAVLSSAIAAYYYLRILVYLYMKEPAEQTPVIALPLLVRVTLFLTTALLVFLSVRIDLFW